MRFRVVFLAVLVLFAPVSVCTAFSLSRDGVCEATIDEVEVAVGSAYAAVLEAEQAGADVSGLLTSLNDASELLTEAHTAYRLGDLDEASRLADLCSELVEAVASEAEQLRLDALAVQTRGVWLTVIGSTVGVVFIVLGGFWGWRVFKRRYTQRVLKMKPEVVSDDS